MSQKKLLLDALNAVDSILEFTQNRKYPEISTDKLLRSGVYWQFAIIGEALAQLRRIDPSTFDQITESTRIVAFRNQIIHGYEVIQDNITWQIIQKKLPILRKELAFLLAS